MAEFWQETAQLTIAGCAIFLIFWGLIRLLDLAEEWRGRRNELDALHRRCDGLSERIKAMEPTTKDEDDTP